MNKHIIFFTTFLCVIALATAAKPCWLGGWAINVVNQVNGTDKGHVYAHCKSKNDDIGFHKIKYQHSTTWKFCENIFGPTTLFFCHAYKGQHQELVFDVFTQDTIKPLCRELDFKANYWRCSWLLRDDGIYLVDRREKGKEKNMKMHDWKHRA
ncbi:putative plant self-incompatibility S1 [Helianthus anomalus]